MRLFAAIDVPAPLQERLRALIDRLRPAAKLSWSTVDHLHITTKFIGEWPEDRLEEMKRTIASAGSPGAIQIAVRGLGWFPNAHNPRVFWAGVEADAGLNALAHSTEQAVARIGVAVEERGFSPHLTLARIRERVPLEPLMRAIETLDTTEFGAFHASAFYLYLSRAGRYSKLAEFPLV